MIRSSFFTKKALRSKLLAHVFRPVRCKAAVLDASRSSGVTRIPTASLRARASELLPMTRRPRRSIGSSKDMLSVPGSSSSHSSHKKNHISRP